MKKISKFLIDRDMSKTDLRLKAGISTMGLSELGKNVSMDVLKKSAPLGSAISAILWILFRKKKKNSVMIKV